MNQDRFTKLGAAVLARRFAADITLVRQGNATTPQALRESLK